MGNLYWGDGSQKIRKIADLSAVVLDSVTVTGAGLNGVGWDGDNLYNTEVVSFDKFYKYKGFSTTIEESFALADRSSVYRPPAGNTYTVDPGAADKAIELLGFSSTVNASFATTTEDTFPDGITLDTGGDTIISGNNDDRVYRYTGFSSTVNNSYAFPTTVGQSNVSNDDSDNVFLATQAPKIYRYTGFSSTIDASISITTPTGLEHDRNVEPLKETSDIIWSGLTADKIYRNFGYTGTVTASFAAPSTTGRGAGFDATDAYSIDDFTDKIYRHTGFAATIADSLTVSGIDTTLRGVAREGPAADTLFTGIDATKIYRLTGFTTTVGDSVSTSTVETAPSGVEMHGANPSCCGTTDDKGYQFTGFTTTLLQSFSTAAVETAPLDITDDSESVYVMGNNTQSMLRYDGYTGTLRDSISLASVDTGPTGIHTKNLLAGTVSVAAEFGNTVVGDVDKTIEVAAEFANAAVGVKVITRAIQEDIEFGAAAAGVNLSQAAANAAEFDADAVGVNFTKRPSVGVAFGASAQAWNLHQRVEVGLEFDNAAADDVPPTFPADDAGVGFGATAAATSGNIFNRSVTVGLNFGTTPQRTYEETVTTAIEFDTPVGQNVALATAFGVTASAEVSKTVDNSATFGVTVGLNIDVTRPVVEPVAFGVRASAYLVGANLNTYDPIDVGPEVGCLTKPPANISLGTRDSTIFRFEDQTVVIRNPELSNSESYDSRKIFRRNRGFEPIVYRDCDWPTDEVHTVDFIALRRNEIEELQTFLRSSLGQRINWTTHENRKFFGIVLNPDTAFEFVRKDWYNVSLQIIVEEGEFSIPAVAQTDIEFGIDTGEGAFLNQPLAFGNTATAVKETNKAAANAVEFGVSASGSKEQPVVAALEFGVEAVGELVATPLFRFVENVNVVIPEAIFLDGPIFIEQDSIFDPDGGA